VVTRFGGFRLDPRRRQLFRGEEPVHLTPKAFDLLGALLEARPEAVAKADLEARIWGKTHVAETSLAGLVAELRSALGERPKDSRYIRTVHGFGYAFCGPAPESSGVRDPFRVGDLVYRIAWARREVALRLGENVLGRVADAAAWMDSPTVSRRHACIRVSTEGATIEDLGSHNGTFLRGERVTKPVPLRDGDEIRLGSVTLTLRVGQAGETQSQD
jgi:DNA-binding winged helix-turn-helix (wHTH) protein